MQGAEASILPTVRLPLVDTSLNYSCGIFIVPFSKHLWMLCLSLQDFLSMFSSAVLDLIKTGQDGLTFNDNSSPLLSRLSDNEEHIYSTKYSSA